MELTIFSLRKLACLLSLRLGNNVRLPSKGLAILSRALKLKYYYTLRKISNPENIYWISPERITYVTAYKEETDLDKNFLGKKIHRRVVNGDWDIASFKFTDLETYKTIKYTIEHDTRLGETDFFNSMLTYIESPKDFWGAPNKSNLQRLCEYLISSTNSRICQDQIEQKSLLRIENNDRAVEVGVGRNGDYFLQSGKFFLSVAKVLGIKSIPVRISVRHRKWQESRQLVLSYIQQTQELGGLLYQPLIHPDLAEIPYRKIHNCTKIMDSIEHHLTKRNGIMLDIGAHTGYFCHRFEDLGYKCFAIEKDPVVFSILTRVREAEHKKFEAIRKSVFEIDLLKTQKFDVVLAFNVFHHFIKKKDSFCKLKELLRNLNTDMMFFEPHLQSETQMKDAYINFSEAEFINFLLDNLPINRSELIYTDGTGRHVYKLYQSNS